MRTNRLHYLHQMPDKKLNFKSILLTFIAVIYLSACGIKGDLYQTPEQGVIPQSTVVEPSDESKKPAVNTLDDSVQQQAVQQPTEQNTTPLVKQPTDQVKEQQ